MKTVQKSVRMSEKTAAYIEGYRGGNFTEKLENLVYDMEWKREAMIKEWERLQGMINANQSMLRRIRERVELTMQVESRLTPLVNALCKLLDAGG